MMDNADSVPPASPTSKAFPSTPDNAVLTSNVHTSTALDRDDEKEKWIPVVTFTRPFQYDQWEQWDG